MKSTNLVKNMTKKLVQHHHSSIQSGFTLIELMMAVAIIAIIAMIAIPSYRGLIIKNAEAKTEAKIKQIQLELEAWRANTLSFKGFEPKKIGNNGAITYGYDANNTTVYLPAGKSASDADYQIVIDDTTGTTLAGEKNLTGDSLTAGNRWRMFATPLNKYASDNASRYYIDSTGMRCKSTSSTFTAQSAKATNCTGTGVEIW